MSTTKAFDFTGQVAIVTGAGSRMPGKDFLSSCLLYDVTGGMANKILQVKLAMDVQLQSCSPDRAPRLPWWTTMSNGPRKQNE